MRNVPFDGCGCDCGGLEVSGVIRNGRRYDDGNVSVETYNQGMQAMQTRINNVGEVVEKFGNDVKLMKDDFEKRISRLESGQDPMIVISGFSATPKTLELGSMSNIIVSWTLSKAPATATLNGVNVLGRTQYTDLNVGSSKDYRLSVVDELGREVKASTSISFVNHIYWGVSHETAITETLVETLGEHVLSDSKARSISIQPYQQYVYYAYPKRLGAARFKQGVFEGGFEEPATIRVTNGSSYTEDYYVYRSTNMLNVAVDITVS